MKPNGSYIPAQMTGIADILGILPTGRFLAIEVKRKGNKTTPNQDIFLKGITDNGGLAIIAYSLDDVISKLWLWAYIQQEQKSST